MNLMSFLIAIIPSVFSAIIPLAIIIALQVYLAKMNQRWLGLILPILTAFYASVILYISIMTGFSNSLSTALMMTVVLYLPTLVLVVIYLRFSKKEDNINEIKIEAIQDLS